MQVEEIGRAGAADQTAECGERRVAVEAEERAGGIEPGGFGSRQSVATADRAGRPARSIGLVGARGQKSDLREPRNFAKAAFLAAGTDDRDGSSEASGAV